MGRLSYNTMKLLFLAISSVTLLFKSCEGGLCLDSGEVASLCTAGTPMADKVASALASCAQQQETVRARKQKGKGKGKGKKCPSMVKYLRILRMNLVMMPVCTVLWVGLMRKVMLTMTLSPWM